MHLSKRDKGCAPVLLAVAAESIPAITYLSESLYTQQLEYLVWYMCKYMCYISFRYYYFNIELTSRSLHTLSINLLMVNN